MIEKQYNHITNNQYPRPHLGNHGRFGSGGEVIVEIEDQENLQGRDPMENQEHDSRENHEEGSARSRRRGEMGSEGG